jgi:hypothetical protein
MERKELRTMAEKQQQDPNELMENGLTREHNENLEKQGENFSAVVSIAVMLVSLWCIVQVMSI